MKGTMKKNGAAKATVALLTFNGEAYIEEVLDAVLKQECNFVFEILVIDSGSTDNTLTYVKEAFKKAHRPTRLIQIHPNEFNHGGTRNLAVKEAKGEYVAFLTQDATPVANKWLQSYIDVFEQDMDIGVAFGPHVPRPGCNPVIKRDIEEVFKSFNTTDKPLIQKLVHGENDQDLNGPLGFFSDVNSCVNKSIWKIIPYQTVCYAEDQLMGRDILKAGYKKAYVPNAAVYHSHTYPIMQYLRRYFDEYRGLNIALNYVDTNATPLRGIVASLIGARNDIKYILSQGYSLSEKVKWSNAAIWINIFRRIGAYLGGRHKKLPVFICNLLSMEYQTKKGIRSK
ncbi:MAG: glycosyltransferase family 2 protein [Paenibacillus sp.]|nr:glycosyltransferase family 2 protein [Paenibacillus sp.]